MTSILSVQALERSEADRLIAPDRRRAHHGDMELVRELDRRSSDRIDVRLLWRERDDRVLVSVVAGRMGDNFSIEVRAGERALDVFHHPYAYAAFRGIETRASALVAA